MLKLIKTVFDQAEHILKNDPAAKSKWEVVLLYPSIKAFIYYKISKFFYNRGFFKISRWISQRGVKKTGIEIHPGAIIGEKLFIDHGTGVVIGETAIVGDRVTIFHGVTLGGTGNEKDCKRHPTVGDDVLIGTGAKILGPVNIGDGAKIGANAVVINDIPAGKTAVGIPAKIIN